MISGQILKNSERYNLLSDTIKKYKPKTVLEIGTWKGLGSTKCIIDSIEDGTNFLSIESNLNFYNIAKDNLINFLDKVKLIYGRIVEKEDVLKFIEGKNLSNDQLTWLNEDLENLEKCENILKQIPNEIDFILLDGGEFSTYHEWVKLKERCKIIALDDIRELKTKEIHNELLTNKNYELIHETSEGNGFSIFIKK